MSASSFSERYASMTVIARGGMGEVTLGVRREGTFRRLVAIKRLRPEFRDDAGFRAMFLEEAEIAGLIRHPHVVPVLDVGVDDEGPYLVMDYVDGITASQILKLSGHAKRLLPVQVVARILHQTALGLAAAHELRRPDGGSLDLIHRDVSPQNILVGYDGTARLADFGIAKAVGSSKTTTGLLKGKVGYMSPEQLRFERPTQRSDLFSLGVVLFEMLAGRRLFRAEDSRAVAQKILSEPTPDLLDERDDVPPDLVELCFELLAKDPEERPATARDVAQRLGDMVDVLVSEEGSLRVEGFLRSHFDAERIASLERTESLVRTWESSRSVDAPSSRLKRSRVAAVAIGIALCAGAVGVAAWQLGPREADAQETVASTPDADPGASDPSVPPEPAVAGTLPGPEATETAVPSTSPTVSEELDPADATGSMARPRPRASRPSPRPRPRPARMQARPAPADDDEPFRALDLIRGTR